MMDIMVIWYFPITIHSFITQSELCYSSWVVLLAAAAFELPGTHPTGKTLEHFIGLMVPTYSTGGGDAFLSAQRNEFK